MASASKGAVTSMPSTAPKKDGWNEKESMPMYAQLNDRLSWDWPKRSERRSGSKINAPPKSILGSCEEQQILLKKTARQKRIGMRQLFMSFSKFPSESAKKDPCRAGYTKMSLLHRPAVVARSSKRRLHRGWRAGAARHCTDSMVRRVRSWRLNRARAE
jgi:hypothetical protein